MGRIVRMTIHEGQRPTKAQIKRLEALKDRPIVFDEDAPEYTMEELEEMRLAAIRKREEQKRETAINDKDLVARSL